MIMFEFLISLIVISLVLVGIDAAQLTAMRTVHNQYYLYLAKVRLHALMERANSHAGQLSPYEIEHWRYENERVLPKSQVSITDQGTALQVVLSWGDQSLEQCKEISKEYVKCLTLLILK